MKRSANFAFLHGICSPIAPDTTAQVLVESEDNSELNRLLRIVFAPDDEGLVHGDIALTMSSKTPPEVIQFIKEVLQQDLSAYRQPALPDGMSDDFAESLAPVLGESKSDYAARVHEIIRYQQNEISDAQKEIDDNED